MTWKIMIEKPSLVLLLINFIKKNEKESYKRNRGKQNLYSRKCLRGITDNFIFFKGKKSAALDICLIILMHKLYFVKMNNLAKSISFKDYYLLERFVIKIVENIFFYKRS